MAINPNYLVTIQTVNPEQGKPIIIRAQMPQQFMYDAQSEYQAPFSQGLFGSGILSSVAKIAGIRLTSQALTAQVWQGSTESQLSLDLEFQTETDPVADVRDPILALTKLATPRMSPGSGMLQSPGPQLDIETATELAKAVGSQIVDEASYLGTVAGSVLGFKQSSLTDSNTQSQNGNNQTQSAVPANGGLGQGKEWKRRVKNQISISIGRYAFFDSVVISNVQKTFESQFDHLTGLPMYARVNIQFKPFFLILQNDLDDIFALQNQGQPQTNSLDSLF